MKKIYQSNKVNKAIAQSRYKELLEKLPVNLFLIEYEEGELLSSPKTGKHLMQIVVDGALSVYYIRDDGSTYSLGVSQRDEIIGVIEFFSENINQGVFVEVTKKLTCLAFYTDDNREALLKEADFLFVLAEVLAKTIEIITVKNAASSSLSERVYAYMLYHCENKRLKGVENAAFHLHCSSRQLQRILNSFVKEGIAKKSGKGTYELCG